MPSAGGITHRYSGLSGPPRRPRDSWGWGPALSATRSIGRCFGQQAPSRPQSNTRWPCDFRPGTRRGRACWADCLPRKACARRRAGAPCEMRRGGLPDRGNCPGMRLRLRLHIRQARGRVIAIQAAFLKSFVPSRRSQAALRMWIERALRAAADVREPATPFCLCSFRCLGERGWE